MEIPAGSQGQRKCAFEIDIFAFFASNGKRPKVHQSRLLHDRKVCNLKKLRFPFTPGPTSRTQNLRANRMIDRYMASLVLHSPEYVAKISSIPSKP
jgi:hypothetical protein